MKKISENIGNFLINVGELYDKNKTLWICKTFKTNPCRHALNTCVRRDDLNRPQLHGQFRQAFCNCWYEALLIIEKTNNVATTTNKHVCEWETYWKVRIRTIPK